MPEISTLSNFIAILRDSKLVSATAIDSIELNQTPKQAARKLVLSGELTAWQGEMLLAGRARFFLGKYKLLDLLGRGGMGAVFLAEQHPMQRKVAIKVLSEKLVNDAVSVARFEREIQAAANVNHPNVIAAYDADRVGSTHFLVMEYVPGQDVGELIQGGRNLPVGLACEIVRQAAIGLSHAHSQGMVHRDVKPGNLLISFMDDGQPMVKVLDLGLSRIANTGDDGSLTKTGQIMGTPDYISPEQARDTKSADARSDIYSLGCTLFALLTGQVPFPGENAIERILRRMTDTAPRVSSIRKDVPAELDDLVAATLERAADHRPQTAAGLAAELRPFCSDCKISKTDVRKEERSTQNADSSATPHSSEQESPRSTDAAVDQEFEDFLGNLQAEADLMEQAVSPDGGATVIHDTETAAEVRSPSAIRTVSGEKLLGELTSRKRRDARRLVIITVCLVLIGAVLGSFALWQAGNVSTIVLDWPVDEREGATLLVDDRERALSPLAQLRFEGRLGTRTVQIHRDGYEPIEMTWSLSRGETEIFRPVWTPTGETSRSSEVERFSRRINAFFEQSVTIPDPADHRVQSLVYEICEFIRNNGGSLPAAQAASELKRLPAPADLLNAADIDPERRRSAEIAIRADRAGNELPPELVAIVGDGRLRTWNSVYAVAFGAGDSWVASGDSSGLLCIWDTSDGRLLDSVQVGSRIWHLIWDDTRQRLFICDGYGYVNVRAVTADGIISRTGSDDGQNDLATSDWRAVAISPDEETLVVIDSQRRLKRLDPDTFDVVQMIAELPPSARHFELAVHPFEPWVAVSRDDGQLSLWNWEDGSARWTVPLRRITNRGMRFSPSGEYLAVTSDEDDEEASEQPCIKIINAATGETLHRLDQNGVPVQSLAFSNDGQFLYSGYGGPKSLTKWSMETWESLEIGEGHPVYGIALSNNGQLLAAAEFGTSVRVLSADTFEGANAPSMLDASTFDHQIAIARDGTQLATQANGHPQIWSLRDGSMMFEVETETYCKSLRFTPDGTLLASGISHSVEFTSRETGLAEQTISGRINHLLFTPSGAIIGRVDHSVVLIEQNGSYRWEVPALAAYNAAAVSPDGLTVFVPTPEEILAVNIESGQVEYAYPLAEARDIAVSPDGQLLFVLGPSAIEVLDVKSGRSIRQFGFETKYDALAMSLDGALIATAGQGELHVWNADSGERTHTIHFASRSGNSVYNVVSDLAFTPDGRHVVTANLNGTCYVFRLSGLE